LDAKLLGVEEKDDLRRLLEAMPLMRLVPLAGHAVGLRFSRVLGGRDGLTSGSGAVLVALGFGGGRGLELGIAGRATHADLARRCMITPATLTGVVNTLVKAGYVRRERDEADRRVVWLVLTEAGWERVRQIGGDLREFAAPVLDALPPEESVVVRRFLTQVILHYSHAEGWECPSREADTAEPRDPPTTEPKNAA
jgi:DNA-binding MarR family transcriptional regulator